MAKAAKRAPARAPAPAKAALQRLAELALKGSPPDRVAREVEAIAAGWLEGADDAMRQDIRERLGEMHDELAAGVDAAQDQVEDLDRSDAAGLKQAGRSLAALEAARDALAAAQRAI
jgi:hypothetical protein